FFFFQAEDGIRDFHVTGVQTCALPISRRTKRKAHIGIFAFADPLRRGSLASIGLDLTGRTAMSDPAARPGRHMAAKIAQQPRVRSEERRVGKAGRARRSPYVSET